MKDVSIGVSCYTCQ